MIVCHIICYGTGALSYILSGGFSGSGIYMIAILQCLIFFILRCKGVTEPRYLAYVFSATYLICSVFTYREPLDILPAVASLACAFGATQKVPSKYRQVMLSNGIIWLIYDLVLPATITMALSHIITIILAIVGIVRSDILAKKE